MAIEIILFNPLETGLSAMEWSQFGTESPIVQPRKKEDWLGAFIIQHEALGVSVYGARLDVPEVTGPAQIISGEDTQRTATIESKLTTLRDGQSYVTEFVDEDNVKQIMFVTNSARLL